VIEAHVLELRESLAGEPRTARAAFSALLGDRRMSVHADASRTFRVEGVFQVAIESESARSRQADGRLDSVVAGGFEPPTSGL
jgi:hypothetical protein